MATRDYRCSICGRVDTYGPTVTPVHCGRPMVAGELGEVRAKDQISIDLVKPQVAPQVIWQSLVEPEQILEVWVFRPGMRNGEKLGWIAQWDTGWEYRAVNGVPNGKGATMTRNEAIEEIFNAFQQ